MRSVKGFAELSVNDEIKGDSAGCREYVAGSMFGCAVEMTSEDAPFGSKLGALNSGSLMDSNLTLDMRNSEGET